MRGLQTLTRTRTLALTLALALTLTLTLTLTPTLTWHDDGRRVAVEGDRHRVRGRVLGPRRRARRVVRLRVDAHVRIR